MALRKYIAGLRKKPQRVRERILLVAMIVIAAILLAVWYLSYKWEPLDMGTGFVKDIASGISKSFSDPAYDQTFGAPSLESVKGGDNAGNDAPAAASSNAANQ